MSPESLCFDLSLRASADGLLMLPAVVSPFEIPASHDAIDPRHRSRPQTATLALIAALLLSPSADPKSARAADSEDSAPFATKTHNITGLIHQVWPLDLEFCDAGERDLLVLSTTGIPPRSEKWITWMPCGSALKPGSARILEHRLPDAAVLVDVARIPGRNGPQLVTISAAGIRLDALESQDPILERAIPGGLPLPARPWEISRVPIIDDWNDDGHPVALVPALSGAWLVNFSTQEPRRIEMPIYASYMTYSPFLPATVWKWLIQEVTWPTLSLADDNGDGRLDLFALSRWGIWIYHNGPEGLPSQPSRRLTLTPFDAETERRHESTVNNYFARDLDGDHRADLLLNTIAGGLMNGHSNTKIYLNEGDGVSLETEPNAIRQIDGGLSGYNFVDVDGDGVDELVETTMKFGIVQMIRILVTRKAETKVRILVLDAESPGGTRSIFEDDFSFGLNFGDSSLTGLIPTLGDWNGDGIKDMFIARGKNAIAFQIGSLKGSKFSFGRAIQRQFVPLESGESRVVDLNGDGLDDIVAFSDKNADNPLVVLRNRGRLPGTRPILHASEE